jgi:flagellar biosynthesis/type III secretory pathway protein FliH
VLASLQSLHSEPEAHIRVAPAFVEEVENLCKECAETANFRGKITVEADAQLGVGDCRVLWQSGASERRADIVVAAVEPLIQRYFSENPKE